VAAQVTITTEFGKQASKFIGDEMGKKQKSLEAEAAQETDPDKKAQLKLEAAKYAEGGVYRVVVHAAVGGLTGGNLEGALGAAGAAASAPTLNELQAKLQSSLEASGMSSDAAKGIAKITTGLGAASIGAIAGGGSTTGAATAFNGDMNNRQLHPDERQKAKELATKSGGRYTAEQIEEQMRLMGNRVLGTEPNTIATLTGEQIPQSRDGKQDPVPGVIYSGSTPVLVETPGTYNGDIQNYIRQQTANPVTGVDSAYVRSQIPSAMPNTSAPPVATESVNRTATGANERAGLPEGGRSPGNTITAEGVADTAATVGRAAGVVSNTATAIAIVPGPHQPTAIGVAGVANVVDFGSKVVEQIARPDVGKGVVEIGTTFLGERANRVAPIVSPISNEIIEQIKNSPEANIVQKLINDKLK
jgi:filamentous hemagglutinin